MDILVVYDSKIETSMTERQRVLSCDEILDLVVLDEECFEVYFTGGMRCSRSDEGLVFCDLSKILDALPTGRLESGGQDFVMDPV